MRSPGRKVQYNTIFISHHLSSFFLLARGVNELVLSRGVVDRGRGAEAWVASIGFCDDGCRLSQRHGILTFEPCWSVIWHSVANIGFVLAQVTLLGFADCQRSEAIFPEQFF